MLVPAESAKVGSNEAALAAVSASKALKLGAAGQTISSTVEGVCQLLGLDARREGSRLGEA